MEWVEWAPRAAGVTPGDSHGDGLREARDSKNGSRQKRLCNPAVVSWQPCATASGVYIGKRKSWSLHCRVRFGNTTTGLILYSGICLLRARNLLIKTGGGGRSGIGDR